jgi:hypothetical protein
MKKLSLILAGALLLGGISFASPIVKKQAQKAPVAKPGPVKPAAKPAAKPNAKPAVKPVAKPAPANKAVK